MNEQDKRYSNQSSNTTFQPQAYRQSGFEQVNPGRAEIHSSSAPNTPDAQQPLVGVIDQGFGAGEHGAEVVKTIAQSNPQSPAWLGGGVGNGTWANSLNKFVDAAKTLGKQAVANLSFDLTEKGSDGSVRTRSQLTKAEQQALTNAHDNGVLIVASSGNQGGSMSALGQASQQFDNIIAVGAADGDRRADYSSFGTGLDLVAPGRQVGDSFAGTSRSAAEVTGTISQMWTANPTLDYRQVSRVLEATATDLQTPGWDAETGAGLLNSRAAVSLAEVITPDTQLFSGAQLLQQVNGSFNDAPWASQKGAIASERTTREFEGESVQEDERLRANYRAQNQAKQPPPVQTTAPKPSGRKERPLSRFDKAEEASIRREQRVTAERERIAKEKAALIQVANNPGISISDRAEAREILRQREAAAKASENPKEPVKPPAPVKKNSTFLQGLAMPRTDNRKYPANFTPTQRASYDAAIGIGKSIQGTVEGIVSMVTHPVDTTKGLATTLTPFNYSAPMSPEERLEKQKIVGNTLIQPYKDAINSGHPWEALTQIGMDWGTMFVPGVGAGVTTARVGGVLGKLGKAAKAAKVAEATAKTAPGAGKPFENPPTPTESTHPPKSGLPSETPSGATPPKTPPTSGKAPKPNTPLLQSGDGTPPSPPNRTSGSPASPDKPSPKGNPTGTIWDYIKPTQHRTLDSANSETIPTAIPRSFEMQVGDQKVWVNGNATRHFPEQLDHPFYAAGLVQQQALLKSFHSAIERALESPTLNRAGENRNLQVDGWELTIDFTPNGEGKLPVVKHAVPKFEGKKHPSPVFTSEELSKLKKLKGKKHPK